MDDADYGLLAKLYLASCINFHKKIVTFKKTSSLNYSKSKHSLLFNAQITQWWKGQVPSNTQLTTLASKSKSKFVWIAGGSLSGTGGLGDVLMCTAPVAVFEFPLPGF